MKMNLLIIFALTLLSVFAKASYSCRDANGHTAQLTLDSLATSLQWSEPWHSADSEGVFAGIEEAPYSQIKGYSKFQLINFLMTQNSSYYLALSSVSGDNITAVTFLNNDDHEEEVTIYDCVSY